MDSFYNKSINKNKIYNLILMALISTTIGCGDTDKEDEIMSSENTDNIDQNNTDLETLEQEILEFGNVSLTSGYTRTYTFTKRVGYRYTICVETLNGNADLYTHYDSVISLNNYQYRSINTGLRSDCVTVNSTQEGTYYIKVYANGANSSYNLRRTTSNSASAPNFLLGKLYRPACTNVTTSKYGPFNSPWGNASSSHNPFFNDLNSSGHRNYIHTGTDYSCAPNTNIKAICTGTVKKLGNLGNGWGYYVVQECPITYNNNTYYITVAYDHLNNAGRPSVGATLTANSTSVGSIYDMTYTGEVDHLHLGICTNRYSDQNCTTLHAGAVHDNSFPVSGFINPDNSAIYR